MDLIFWGAVVTFLLGAPRLVSSWRAAGERIDRDVEFLRAIPAGMNWPTEDIEQEEKL